MKYVVPITFLEYKKRQMLNKQIEFNCLIKFDEEGTILEIHC